MTESHPSNLLFLDTATNHMMVGISVDQTFVYQYQETQSSHRYHSAILIPTLQEALAEAGLSINDIQGIGVNIGPGSFTGVRTGIVTARTLAQFLKGPLFAFNSFELLAETSEETVIFQDALRGNAYHATLQLTPDGPHYIEAPALVSLDDLSPATLKGKRVLISQSMAEWFEPYRETAQIQEIESLTFFTPAKMLSLVQNHAKAFETDWRQLSPLYLQSPNITIRKPKAGKLS